MGRWTPFAPKAGPDREETHLVPFCVEHAEAGISPVSMEGISLNVSAIGSSGRATPPIAPLRPAPTKPAAVAVVAKDADGDNDGTTATKGARVDIKL